MTQTHGNLICFIGTSLINQANRAGSNYIYHTGSSHIRWASGLNNGLIRCPVYNDQRAFPGWGSRNFWGFNAGVSGQTCQEIWDRRFDIVNYLKGVDRFVVDMGTNDMGSLTAEEINQFRYDMCDFLKDYAPVTLLTILARGSGSWPIGGDQFNKALQINQDTLKFPFKIKGLEIFDWNEKWVDQDSEDYQPRTGASYDEIHVNGKGAYWIGKNLGEYLKSRINTRAKFNIYENELFPFEGSSGGTTNTTGDVFTNYRFERSTGTATGVAEIEGDKQKLTISCNGGGGDSLFYFRTNAANFTHGLADKWVMCRAEIEKLTTNDAVKEIRLLVQDAPPNTFNAADGDDNPADNFPSEKFTKLFEIPHLKLLDVSTDLRFRIEITVDNSLTEDVELLISAPELGETDAPNEFFGEFPGFDG